jgi:hypothetical protein
MGCRARRLNDIEIVANGNRDGVPDRSVAHHSKLLRMVCKSAS